MHELDVFDDAVDLRTAELDNAHIIKFGQFLLHPQNDGLVDLYLLLVFKQQPILMFAVE